ncbi:Hypothetical predicted protein [Pelobates cultripes]|uniref:Uncharacterized protein n=1 Tax=Pelobates cultripes TaxID=61616 RepID=A0AAD1VVR5_PELCU|nr:Hypothetical predicted protein [Pelobates cultripes]
MPFIYRQTGRKARCSTKAYSYYRAFETALHNAVFSTALSPTENTTTDPATMGRKSQRIATGACKDTQDISTMLQHTVVPKMAATPDPDTSSTCSELAIGDTLDQLPPQGHQPQN